MFQSGRSTKGASKQRRDCINVEIQNMRVLLPVSDVIRQRLSQLQIMSLCNAYIAKSNYLELSMSRPDQRSTEYIDLFDFSQALPGFLLMISLDGKILYISENIAEYLGHSMVEMITQADTVYDIIDAQDTSMFREILYAVTNSQVSSLVELNFTCRMNIPRRRQPGYERHKTIQVRGRLMYPRDGMTSQPVLIATCTPHISVYTSFQSPTILLNTTIFWTEHSLDMKIIDIDKKSVFHLGYTRSEILNKSWYELIHPVHLEECKRKHTDVVHGADTVRAMCVRLQTKQGHMIWLHIVMHLNSDEEAIPHIFCINHVVSEEEVDQIRARDQTDEDLMKSQNEGPREACLPTVISEEGMSPLAQPAARDEVKRRLKRKLEQNTSNICQENDSSESDWMDSPRSQEQFPLYVDQTGSLKSRSNMTSPFQMFGQAQASSTSSAINRNQEHFEIAADVKPKEQYEDMSFFSGSNVDHKRMKMTNGVAIVPSMRFETPFQPALPELDQVVVEDFFTQVASPPQFHAQFTDIRDREIQEIIDMNPVCEMMPELGDAFQQSTNVFELANMFETIFEGYDFINPDFDKFSSEGELFDRFATFSDHASSGRLVRV